jgi:putative addiction module killer protein
VQGAFEKHVSPFTKRRKPSPNAGNRVKRGRFTHQISFHHLRHTGKSCFILLFFIIFASMKQERKIIAFKHYYREFMQTLNAGEQRKIHYVLDMLATQERISAKFVKFIRDGVYELRAEYESNSYRIFFIFDGSNIVVLFNGFQKKTQKTPESEIKKAIQLKEEYYGSK